jgi:UDP-N-acetylmuramoyl-L-alanyl-D-glutamate--2,6-diaminopimelate ligase
MVKKGVKYVVMEVSAHAIFYKKTYGINFFGAIFTNFSQDHLDFFKDMRSYEEVKLNFFKNNNFQFVVTNADDNTGRKISELVPKAITYGIDNPADVFAIDVALNKNGTTFVINLFDCIYDIKLNLLGKFNVSNALAAATACSLAGVPIGKVKNALYQVGNISGRLEIAYDKDYLVIVDYAHTPDGLEKVLKVLKPLAKNRLICLFGCGGNRDKDKRRKMGEIAGELADFTIITSDNPRYEEPYAIIREIESGLRDKTLKYITIQNRYMATGYALSKLKKGDTLILAGKGAENYQEIMGVKLTYSDKEAVKDIIAKLDFGGEII